MTRIEFDRPWRARAVAGPVPDGLTDYFPATVPGSVHTDLLASGLIADPYLDSNESELQWIGRSDFAYENTFDAPAGTFERVDLVCDGLDTIAAIDLNGRRIGETRNQHRSYRFDVGELLRDGDNDLRITFASALDWAERAESRIGAKPYVGNAHPYNAIRKMAANFGWDWGPDLVTAGIWRPIYLDAWSRARLASVVPVTSVTPGGQGVVSIAVAIQRTSDAPVTVRARLRGHGAEVATIFSARHDESSLKLRVDSPELWWPRGYGEQAVYDLDVELVHDGVVLDAYRRSVGFRSIEARDEPDQFGTGFSFYVNGERILVKGANWIPDDCFLPRVTEKDYAAGVRDAVEAGFNLLRIWGGGIFESDTFYEECTRAGVMVWQDFLFACAAYSEAPELWDEVEAEARENVARLAPHASLVFYNGSNENIEGFYEWGWKELLAPGEDWGNGYYSRLLPEVLASIDPSRPYRPSSPFSPTDPAHPQDPDQGTVHSWEVWNRQDYTTYRDHVPRFVSEFGFQAPPAMSTIREAIHDEPLASDSPGMLHHQKAEDGNGKLERGFVRHLPAPTSFDDWHFTTQLNQAHAITYGVEHFRSHFPRNTGTIIWQLNDCWPVTSWSAVDSSRRRKPLWYALRALNAPRLLTIQPRGDKLALVVGNDSPAPWTEIISVRRVGFDGEEYAVQYVSVHVPPRSASTHVLAADIAVPARPDREVLVAESGHARLAFWYFAEDRSLELSAPRFTSTVTRTAEGYEIEIAAGTLLKDVSLFPDRLDPAATVSDMLVTLLPGDRVTLSVTTERDLDPDALVSWPVLNSVNHLLMDAAATRASGYGLGEQLDVPL
ncbi:glycosyl hydrolase 2 galactose-binding domain-containing protein [Leifsonia xyli]|uniref:glycoside hydrolase family 2 protein n=1 Tax=Leifsonia xyli TaxID=1575 RepID=UPI0007D09027